MLPVVLDGYETWSLAGRAQIKCAWKQEAEENV
jgi:hypothetical protein